MAKATMSKTQMGEIFKYCHSYDGKEHLSRVAMLNGDLGQSLVGLAALAVVITVFFMFVSFTRFPIPVPCAVL